MLSWDEVIRHYSRDSCLVVVSGQAYDVTNFIDEHPGGAKSLLRYGGKDGTEEYELLHPAGTIGKTLSPGVCSNPAFFFLSNPSSDQYLGPVNSATLPSITALKEAAETKRPRELPITFCMNLDDIELAAQKVLNKRAWAYFNSAADSLESLRTNSEDWKKYLSVPGCCAMFRGSIWQG
jgi:L-lactate dehydrogenase (cytochrome)